MTLQGGGGGRGSNPGPAATACHLPVCTTGPFPADTQEGLLCCWRNNCCSFSGGMKLSSKPAYPGAAAGPGHVSQEPLPAVPSHVRSMAQALENWAHRKLLSPRRALAITMPQSWAKTRPAQRKKRLFLRASQQPRKMGGSTTVFVWQPPSTQGSRQHHQRLLSPTERPPEACPREDTQPNKTRTRTETRPPNTEGRQEHVI